MEILYKKYRKLLAHFTKLPKDEVQELIHELSQEETFVTFVRATKDWTNDEHDGLLMLLEPKKNAQGYYTDKYGNRISYNGIRTLKQAKAELPENPLQDAEWEKCSKDFKYFRRYYCFITTKVGKARPEARYYQETLEDELLSLEDIVILYPRQSGKTVTSATYLLWVSIFHPVQINIGIVANKPKTAREVLDKIKKIFSELPIWLMPGISVWNKGDIEYGNETRIMTDSPSSDSFRGYTCNVIYVDEAAYIKKSLWDEMLDAVVPTMNSLIYKQFIVTSTANGMNHFKHLVDAAKRKFSEEEEKEAVLESTDIVHIGGNGVELTPEEVYQEFLKIQDRRQKQLNIQVQWSNC